MICSGRISCPITAPPNRTPPHKHTHTHTHMWAALADVKCEIHRGMGTTRSRGIKLSCSLIAERPCREEAKIDPSDQPAVLLRLHLCILSNKTTLSTLDALGLLGLQGVFGRLAHMHVSGDRCCFLLLCWRENRPSAPIAFRLDVWRGGDGSSAYDFLSIPPLY